MAAFGENPEEDAAMMAAIGVDPEDRAALIAAANAEIGRGEPEARDEPEEPAAALRWDDAAEPPAALRWDAAPAEPRCATTSATTRARRAPASTRPPRASGPRASSAPQGGRRARRPARRRRGLQGRRPQGVVADVRDVAAAPRARREPRRARFAAEVSSPKPRKARSHAAAATTTREARVKFAGGRRPAAGRRASRARRRRTTTTRASRPSPTPPSSTSGGARGDDAAAAGVQFESGKKKKRKARKSPRFPDDAMATRPAGQSQTPGNPEDPDAAPIVQVQFFAAPEAVEEAAKRKAANRAKRRAQEEAETKSLRGAPVPATTDGGALAAPADDAARGFLLAFLVASGVDAPRAVRAAARLRDANCGDTALHAAGLRSHEIRQLLRSAKLARSALRSSPRKRLPKIRDKNLRSKSAQDQATSSAYGGRGVKPSIDPTSWAKKRKEQVLSAERRRKIRQTE
ncbi:hypothetical protein JL722_9318 [Aureococcus anophagefferens]|nr:hypothetical protein JL722_9318 [Aureococcus anophagefferens]